MTRKGSQIYITAFNSFCLYLKINENSHLLAIDSEDTENVSYPSKRPDGSSKIYSDDSDEYDDEDDVILSSPPMLTENNKDKKSNSCIIVPPSLLGVCQLH